MSWLKKLEITRAAIVARPEMMMVFSESGFRTLEDDLNELRRHYPFVSEDYMQFLRMCDGLQVDTCVLFGSGKTSFTSRGRAAKRWGAIVDLRMFVPIGEDGSGRCFALNQLGEVWRFEHDPPEPETARMLSESFSDFLENVLMGPRFVELFDGFWRNRTGNEWSEHLKTQGWLKIEN